MLLLVSLVAGRGAAKATLDGRQGPATRHGAAGEGGSRPRREGVVRRDEVVQQWGRRSLAAALVLASTPRGGAEGAEPEPDLNHHQQRQQPEGGTGCADQQPIDDET